MLHSLEYAVEFPTTGRSFQNRIEFAPGLTAITGRNEAGKTLVVEMIGYALFGKDALRGLASDYRNLLVSLTLLVRDEEWSITRAKKEEFTVNGEVVAVGAQAINAEVPKRLGFDLNVFNIACAAQQGDLGALTEMRPTARRQMVDQLIGLDQLEDIEKLCKAEAKTNETVALSLLASTAAPVEPEQPDGYKPSGDLDELLRNCIAHEDERLALARVEAPTAPVEPTAPPFINVEELEAIEAARQLGLREKASLEGQLRGMPEATVSREDLAKALAYKEYQDEVRRRGPRPDYTLEQLSDWEHAWSEKDKLRGDTVHCPKCDHEFSAYDPDLDVAAIEALPEPPLVRTQILEQSRRHHLWATPLTEVSEFELPNLQQEILAHAHAEDRAGVVAALAALDIPVDRSADLRAARAYQNELAAYGERARQYDRELDRYKDAQARLGALADRSGELVDLQGRLAAARHYEALRGRFADDKARYDGICDRAGEARDLADGFTRGSAALRGTRVRVKQELAPSLSKAASSLLYTMTNGERRFVDVDHDFNIAVDGQPLQTLSGSGKSVVNLALRIGLGQVLTSKVLPIFCGDEVDADCDKDRAGAVASTFQTLKQYLTQIILVTHKEIEADQVIQL